MRIRKQCEVWSWAVVVAVLVVPRAAAAQSAAGMALHYLTTERSRSAYVGGGLSWGSGSLSRGSEPPHSSATSWHGNGLQAELTTGYELGRGSDLRLFIQGDASLPLFMVTSTTYVPTPGVRGSSFAFAGERRYLPSAVISLGIGWARR